MIISSVETYDALIESTKLEEEFFETFIGCDYLELKDLKEGTSLLNENLDGIKNKIIKFIDNLIQLIKRAVKNIKKFISRLNTKEEEKKAEEVLKQVDKKEDIDYDNIEGFKYIKINFDLFSDMDKRVEYVMQWLYEHMNDIYNPSYEAEIRQKSQEALMITLDSETESEFHKESMEELPPSKESFKESLRDCKRYIKDFKGEIFCTFEDAEDVLTEYLEKIKRVVNTNKYYNANNMILPICNFTNQIHSAIIRTYQSTLEEIFKIAETNINIADSIFKK